MLLNYLLLDTGLWSARIIIQGRQPSRYTRKTGEINLTFAQTHVKTQMCILAHWSLVIMMIRLIFLEIYAKNESVTCPLQTVGWMVFYFRKDVKYSMEYFLYSATMMISEVGGSLGLLLGISLFDLSLVIDCIIDSCCRYRDNKIGSGQVTAKKIKVKPM